MKKLVKVRLINWHYLSNETIVLDGNTLLTGPNASGKSTIMDAIAYVLTAGETQFNVAANEKSKRDLRGYVKCKLGMDNKEYLRNGDVSGHIALQFHDEKTNTDFTVGVVMDAFGDLTPVKTIFYKVNQPITDSMFISGDSKIFGTVEFRKHNPSFEYFLTKKDAKRGFRTAYGSINEDFYRLIPKALAFKPISDVKGFIYQNILEEKAIDVSPIKDSIRAYKELEITLKSIQEKIGELKEIEAVYGDIVKIQDEKDYIDYLMHLFDVEEIKREIEDTKRSIDKEEVNKTDKQNKLFELEQEINSLNERSRELYNLLANNDSFKAEETINRDILRTETNIQRLEQNAPVFQRKVYDFVETLNKLRKLSDEKVFQSAASIKLISSNEQDVEDAKVRLRDLRNQLETIKSKENQELGNLNAQKNNMLKEIGEISRNLKMLDNNKVNFPPEISALRNEIADGLKRIHNYDISVHILAELLEIKDRRWADTIEIFLANRRFNLIVEPRYFDDALMIYNRIKGKYRIYGYGLVNTKKVAKFDHYEKNSLASIIETDNKDARAFVNFTCGNVIMCEEATELENYSTAITNDLLIYRGFVVSSLDPRVPKPFIGKNAAAQSQEQWKLKAAEINKTYSSLTEKMNVINSELDLLGKLDIRNILEDIDSPLQLEREKNALSDLRVRAKRQKTATPTELQDDYDKVIQTIKNCDQQKNALNIALGGCDAKIKALNETLNNKTIELEKLNKDLHELAKGSVEIEERAKDEYQTITKNSSFKKALAEYQEKYRAEENSYNNLKQTLLNKEYAYTTKYNLAYSYGLEEVKAYLTELNKLEKSDLISYEGKVRQAREAAEAVLKEDFIAKLRNNILTAEQEISKINDTLANITFGNDKYAFIFPRNSEFAPYYEMVLSDLSDMNQGLFTYEFETKYAEQIKQLFDSLAVDDGALNKFTDYRMYMDYDIRITNTLTNETMTYSKVSSEKSGGETQVPFYVAIIASFVRVYTKTGYAGGDPIGLVMFDEVFDKMDANRMKAMMNFINSMPLQVIIACPPQRMDILREFASTTLIMVRQGNRAGVLPVVKKEEE